ncbi:MAG: isoleucine--tRNA ligase [Actinobacteria bacterium]|nr:isoleucine--tRNA ligase [Actinomycetota bacterium]
MNDKHFTRVQPSVSFPELEERILDLWDEIDAFHTSVEMRPQESEYTFYDGPPFATGSPHYGNLLAGVIKDIVPRYWTMRGHKVVRRFGWDTHGLPIEMEVQEALGLNGPRDVEAYGVRRFNEACRARVQTNTEAWERITRRIGRWVDFQDDYKTMDLDFMESVWWVFQQLWKKGLIYRAFKVLPYSWGASTPLSNFEANLEYRDVDDPAITVRLPVLRSHGPVREGDYFVVWTTTPWTLPGNLAVAVGEDISYVAVLRDHERHWVAEARKDDLWPDGEVVATASGRELVGAAYKPPFDYFETERENGAFRVISSAEVTTEDGTGLVHMAPAYGEADFYALRNAGLDVLVDPVNAEARFTEDVPDVAGMYVKDADAVLIELLERRGLLVKREQIRHSYPFCYRTHTPLIYKAIPTWFVKVEAIKDRMVDLNEQIHWVPDYVGRKRFGNWLENARDWAISRNRYWGSCIPVWECESCSHQTCIGSVDELEAESGVRLTDLHKHIVDEVTIPCPECGAVMHRVPEVLDVWFESGSMPYAQHHYPFENADTFDLKFPADFIAEGLDQTRGWFYTLLVLASAIFDEMPFRNCVVNGMILAEDGHKMSKSLKNYPDPMEVLSSYGADPLRAYLINSPLLRAEPLRFTEAGVKEVTRTVILPLWNAYSFFTTYAEADGITRQDLAAAPPPGDRPELDRWILSMLQSLISRVNEMMEGYYLYAVVPPMIEFIDHLTNWYIRRSRRRFWRAREASDSDKLSAFATLYDVLVTFSKVIAPVLPFVTEEIYQGLVVTQREPGEQGPAGVHLSDYPLARRDLIDGTLERQMATVRSVVTLGRSLRVANSLRVRQPLRSITVFAGDELILEAINAHASIIADELNVKQVLTGVDESVAVDIRAKANFRALGPRLGAAIRDVASAIADLSRDSIESILAGTPVEILGRRITSADIVVQRSPKPGMVVAAEGPLSVVLDVNLSDELRAEGLARELINRIQQLRRDGGLAVSDRITALWSTDDASLTEALERHRELIMTEVLARSFEHVGTVEDGQTLNIDGATVHVHIERAS